MMDQWKSQLEKMTAPTQPDFTKMWQQQYQDFMSKWGKEWQVPQSMVSQWESYWKELWSKNMGELSRMQYKDQVEAMMQQWSTAIQNSPWSKWYHESHEQWVATLRKFVPEQQQPFMDNYFQAVQALEKNWEELSHMMKTGLYSKEAILQFLQPDTYQKFVAQLFGYTPFQNTEGITENIKKMYDFWLQQLNSGNTQNIYNIWKENSSNMHNSANNWLNSFNVLQDSTIQTLDSWMHMSGAGNKMEAIHLLKNMQNDTIQFVMKSQQMQEIFQNASLEALSDKMKSFSQNYVKSNTLPDFKGFFQDYIQQLENALTNNLESKSYSKLQSEIATLSTKVKSGMEQLFTLMMSRMPLMTMKHADEIAMENSTLRRKLRQLEERLEELEDKKKINPSKSAFATDYSFFNLREEVNKITGHSDVQDDIILIRGIGEQFKEVLFKIGITSFEQIARFNDDVYQLMDEHYPGIRLRALKEKWAEQAKEFLNKNVYA